jgi:hypothetical protein
MKELPEPDSYTWGANEPNVYTPGRVKAIQRQAYEDGLRDAAELCNRAKPIGGRAWSAEQAACFECLTHVESAILAMLTASQKPRCELCGYQHGHAIGCANNPVDIALGKEKPSE